jgi:diguanylate cyclase (GGDEF)-like protein
MCTPDADRLRRIARTLLECGLDPASADPHLLLRTRVTSSALFIAIGLAPILGPFYATIASPWFTWVYAGGALAWMACYVALWRTQRPLLVSKIGLTILWAVCNASFWLLGGFSSPILCWLFVLPIATSVLSDSRGVWVASLAAAITCAGYWAMPQLGIDVPNTLRPEYANLGPLVYRELALAVMAALLWIWMGSQRSLEHRLAESLARAEEERQNVGLLLEASAASNASAGFREVAPRNLEGLARALGAQVGRLWLRTSAGALAPMAEFRGPEAEGAAYSAEFSREFVSTEMGPVSIDLTRDPRRPHHLLFHPVIVEGEAIGLLELNVASTRREPRVMLDLLAHVASQLALVAERERANESIRALAYVDPLSGLPNRLAFQERLPLVLSRLAERGRKAALLFVDLNGFKRVNDSLGHGSGDALLREVARRLRRALRMSDHLWRAHSDAPALARFGGDEFTVLITEITQARGAEIVAMRILDALSAPVQIHGHETVVGASIGIALFPEDAESGPDLIQRADQAMYRAKLRGGSAFERYDGNADVTQRRFELGEELRRAFDEGALRLEYQPLFRTRDGALVGAEALVRWTHPERGAISPAEFVPLAEATGLIERLGRWVVEQACRQTLAWEPMLPAGFRVAANVSARQLHAPFEEQLRELFAAIGCDPRRLEVELTESALLVSTANVEQRLRSIVALGVNVVLDDFGTGYSSLAFLKQFPIAKVKIDRGFVAGLPDEKGDVAITLAILGMARSLGLSVVAEGVEDEAQHEFLMRHGCEAVQGHLLGRPVPPAEFEARWLRG